MYKLVQYSIAAEVVETAYNNWAHAEHRSALLEKFYGATYAVFKVGFYDNVCKLVQHGIVAEVMETLYNNWAYGEQRSALLEEFYGATHAVFKVGS